MALFCRFCLHEINTNTDDVSFMTHRQQYVHRMCALDWLTTITSEVAESTPSPSSSDPSGNEFTLDESPQPPPSCPAILRTSRRHAPSPAAPLPPLPPLSCSPTHRAPRPDVYSPTTRAARVERFLQKRRARRAPGAPGPFRYTCRQRFAASRKRAGGRFLPINPHATTTTEST